MSMLKAERMKKRREKKINIHYFIFFFQTFRMIWNSHHQFCFFWPSTRQQQVLYDDDDDDDWWWRLYPRLHIYLIHTFIELVRCSLYIFFSFLFLLSLVFLTLAIRFTWFWRRFFHRSKISYFIHTSFSLCILYKSKEKKKILNFEILFIKCRSIDKILFPILGLFLFLIWKPVINNSRKKMKNN